MRQTTTAARRTRARRASPVVTSAAPSAVEPLEPGAVLADGPAGLTDTQVAAKLNSPTAMAVAPDGRVFFTQQNGQIRGVKNGQLLSAPFATVTANADAERGLLGIT